MSTNHLAARAALSVCAALALASSSPAQTIWHVDASAAPGGDGLTWATAMDSLQSAIDVAIPADRIWVAAGTYLPTNLSNPPDPRSATFSIASHLKLFGGFDGTETILSERDPALFDDTILSGDIGIPGDASDNAYGVVSLPSFAAPGIARIDGFRITGGNAVENGGAVRAGITTLPAYNPRVTLLNCTLNDNSANKGGAIAVENFGVVRLVRCVVERNTAASQGGAVYSKAGGLLAVNTRFLENKSGNQGGALWADSGTNGLIEYANCVFIANKARLGGVAYLKGGSNMSGVASWYNCTFVENEASEIGGVVYAITGTPVPASVDIYNSILWNNYASSNPSIFGTGLDVRFSDVEGTYPGVGNVAVDPLFVTVDQPMSGSPVNDAGSNGLLVNDFLDIDFDNNTGEELPLDILERVRRADDPLAPDTGAGSPPLVDMGAYESGPQHGGG